MEQAIKTIPELNVTTQDGWKLKAYHHVNQHSKFSPILVFHAMSLSAYSMNGNEGLPSIGVWLSLKGFDVWVCECRGVGKSFHKDKRKRKEWTFDEHLNYDVPAFLDSIQKETNKNKFHWIGHSMGGHLLLAHLCVTNDNRIQSGVIAGSGFEVSDSIDKYAGHTKLLNVLQIKIIPLKLISRLSRPLLKMIPDNYGYFSKKLTGYRNCLTIMKDIHDIPTSLLKYAFNCYRKGGLRNSDGKVIYSEKAKEINIPLLFISGNMDLAWIPQVIQDNIKFFSSGITKALPFGKEYGHIDNYGHVDIMMGKNSEKEVFPEILNWLMEKEKKYSA